MKANLFQQAQFLTSAAKLSQCPPDNAAEVAFIGRSNSGKSSALNTICSQKTLARTSKTPGRTQLINFFELDEAHRLVDLPGYGYAKVPVAIKVRWQETLGEFLATREGLRGLVLIMDSRHPLKPQDQAMMTFCEDARLPVHILLTKSDKLSSGAAKAALREVQSALIERDVPMSAQLFSAPKHTGVPEARAQLVTWLSEVQELE